jgi:coenzyme F420-reducing hydrogenase beta subunit
VKKKSIVTKPPEEFLEVLRFLDAKAALEEFKADNAAVFEQFAHLVDRYNSELEQAEKAVRQQEVKCGPFDAYQVSVKYDPEALYDAVGRELFLQVGGAISNTTTYAIDKGRFDAAVTMPNSKIKDEVVSLVRKEIVNYHMPPKLVTP